MVGLTGGIGAGKSAVAERLAAHGAVVIDSDRLAREAAAPGTDGRAGGVAEEETRVERLGHDRGMPRDEATARIRAQATDEQRRAVADVVIVNDGTIEDLHKQVDEVWRDRLSR